jgi:hypothetical protein
MHGPPPQIPGVDYEPLPLDQNLAHARAILDRLHGQPLELPDAGHGECDDCKHTATLVQYARLLLCRRCARLRHDAGKKPEQSRTAESERKAA